MKDSFGGTIMIYVVIFFLAIYVVLIGLTLRYAQAFKTKNKIIDIIEQYDGIKSIDTDVNDAIIDHLENVNVKPKEVEIEMIKNGDDRKTCYYKVSSKITWSWPFFNYYGEWEIKGETKNVKNCNNITFDNNLFN